MIKKIGILLSCLAVGMIPASLPCYGNNQGIQSTTVSLFTDNATAIKGGANAVVRLVRSGGDGLPLRINWKKSGTATEGVDCNTLPVAPEFAQGEMEIVYQINRPTIDNIKHPTTTLVLELLGAPYIVAAAPTSATVMLTDPNPVQQVIIGGVIVSGAPNPDDAVESKVPNGVIVKGGIIALGGGSVTTSGTSPANIIPEPRYQDGTWVPPVSPYGIDIRVKSVSSGVQ